MTISDRDLAALAEAAYRGVPTWRGPSGACADAAATLTVLPRAAAADEVCVVACRGTGHDELLVLLDLLHDLDFRRVQDPDLGWCDEGFLSLVLALLEPILSDPRTAPSASARGKIQTTGHSLGGVIALGLAAKLAARGFRVLTPVTFGAPRLGMGDRFLQAFAAIGARQYRCGNDPVPDLPPAELGWLHVRDQIRIGAPRHIAIEDHLMANYRAALGEKP